MNNEKSINTAKVFGVIFDKLVSSFSVNAKILAKNSNSETNISFAFSYCCSRCGKSDDFCNDGCQSKFDECKLKSKSILPVSDDGRFGPKYDRRPDGLGCNQHGWCDNSDEHYGVGCQPDYGMCY
ncbi:hypothetical protein PIROE2DRAFT_2382 [Piromyces sp. E2]|nr:hypothetical protein PIROE2DRAFT_2382 [Piromyces sp. E2]|eukprot:OUM69734.1 hypothetical protein PIROE2DRAFT_2382 [Piromyces sp. E2]